MQSGTRRQEFKPILITEESKTYLTAISNTVIDYLVRIFTDNPLYFTRYLADFDESITFTGRFFKNLEVSKKTLKLEPSAANENDLSEKKELNHNVYYSLKYDSLITDFVRNLGYISFIIDEEHYLHVRGVVSALFKPITENTRWKILFDGIAPITPLSPAENEFASGMKTLSLDKKRIVFERIAGGFAFIVQGFAFDQKKISAENISFTRSIINYIYTDAKTYVKQERKNKINVSIDQAINITAYSQRVTDKNEDLLQAMKDNLLHGINSLFTHDLQSSQSRRMAFETLGDKAHLKLNKKLVKLTLEIFQLPPTPARQSALDSIVKATLEHFNHHYKTMPLSPEIPQSLCKTCDIFLGKIPVTGKNKKSTAFFNFLTKEQTKEFKKFKSDLSNQAVPEKKGFLTSLFRNSKASPIIEKTEADHATKLAVENAVASWSGETSRRRSIAIDVNLTQLAPDKPAELAMQTKKEKITNRHSGEWVCPTVLAKNSLLTPIKSSPSPRSHSTASDFFSAPTPSPRASIVRRENSPRVNNDEKKEDNKQQTSSEKKVTFNL